MTPEETRKAAEVMLAFAEGKKVQFRSRHGSVGWMNHEGKVKWNWQDMEYRVKPEPRRWWLRTTAMDGW